MNKATEFKDAIGQPIKIGDLVACIRPGKASLIEGTIDRFRHASVIIHTQTFMIDRRKDQVVKLSNELRLMRILES